MVKGLDHSSEDTVALELRVWRALAAVHDPEIPPASITDLGIVEGVRVSEEQVEVDLLPTFSGCPALDVIREDAEAAVAKVAGDRAVHVAFVYAPPWTSDRISPEGRSALESHGITPPGGGSKAGERVVIPLASLQRNLWSVDCPFCGSRETVMESAFGPTLCRSTHFCKGCRNPFEAFKPKVMG
jgi:ring-1,2-phenylacetyl-CoA epoxidase subunit PaaD